MIRQILQHLYLMLNALYTVRTVSCRNYNNESTNLKVQNALIMNYLILLLYIRSELALLAHSLIVAAYRPSGSTIIYIHPQQLIYCQYLLSRHVYCLNKLCVYIYIYT